MLRISFDFNETSKIVSNVKVEDINGSRKIVSNSSPNIPEIGPDVEVLDNKLQLSQSAVAKLDARADDRISIQYINEGIGKACPIIGKAEIFTDRLDGNRLSAKRTISFRGEKRNTLIEFGTLFNLEEYKDGVWKLIPYKDSEENEPLTDEENDAEALNSSELEQEIEEITSSMADDDLPF